MKHTVESIKDPENVVSLTDDDLKQILSGLSEDAVLVGGQALMIWSKVLDVYIRPDERTTFSTKDVDFLATVKSLFAIGEKWTGSQIKLSKPTDITAIVGQAVNYSSADNGYKIVDIIHRIVGDNGDDVRKRAIKIKYENNEFLIHHPIDILKARFDNVRLLKSKQDTHGIKQAEVAIRIAKAFLTKEANKIKETKEKPKEILKDLEKVAIMATSEKYQGIALSHDLDIMDAIPVTLLETISEFASFVKHRYSRLIVDAEKIKNKQQSKKLKTSKP